MIIIPKYPKDGIFGWMKEMNYRWYWDAKRQIWCWQLVNDEKTEDAEFEIIEPKQLDAPATK